MAAGGVLVIEYAPYRYARLVFALPLLFVLPGYAITQALFAGRPRSLSQLSLLTIGLSLSVSILTALVLSLATNGLRVGSWLTVVVAIVLGACWAAFRRRQSLEPEIRSDDVATYRGSPACARATWSLLVIAGVVHRWRGCFARMPLPAKNVQGYTALSIAQSSAETPPAVRVNVTSEEQQTRVYRIGYVGTKVVYADNIELVPGQNVERDRSRPSPKRGEQVRVEAALYWNYKPDTSTARCICG